MKCRLFNMLSAVSLLLCVVLAVLWAGSYWVKAGWTGRGDSYSVDVFSKREPIATPLRRCGDV